MGKEKERITVYQKPTCSTCREVVKLVEASGRPYITINYYDHPFTKAQLKDLLSKSGLRAKDIVRTKEEAYKKLKIAQQQLSDDDLIDLMLRYPDLIQRPLVEKGLLAMLARPAEKVKTLLKN
jgi:arsenate reductase